MLGEGRGGPSACSQPEAAHVGQRACADASVAAARTSTRELAHPAGTRERHRGRGRFAQTRSTVLGFPNRRVEYWSHEVQRPYYFSQETL